MGPYPLPMLLDTFVVIEKEIGSVSKGLADQDVIGKVCQYTVAMSC